MTLRIGIPLIQSELNAKCGWIAGLYFVKNCIQALATLPDDKKPDVFIFIPEDYQLIFAFENTDSNDWLNIVKIPIAELTNTSQQHLVEAEINSYNCDIYFPMITIPQFAFQGRMIGWIPDLQDKYFPKFFSNEELEFRNLSTEYLLNYCDKILCTSNSVSDDIHKFYFKTKCGKAIIHFRSNISINDLNQNPSNVLSEFDINQKYLFLPNQFWVHKNHKVVFEALNYLKKQGHVFHLVCTGSPEDYRFPNHYQELLKYIDKNNLTDQVHLLGFIDRDKQIQLYRGATIVLQPSLFEGWNTSVEDANALGKQLIVSDIKTHREQCGTHGIFFDPHNAIELADILAKYFPAINGFSAKLERLHFIEYQSKIREFGHQLIQLFNETIENVTAPKFPMANFHIRYNRQMQIICEERNNIIKQLKDVCEERTKLINELHNECAAQRELIDRMTYRGQISDNKLLNSYQFYTGNLINLIKEGSKRFFQKIKDFRSS